MSKHRSITFNLGAGRASVSARLDEPSGVILIYRLTAPAGSRIHATAQLPGITVPLRIATVAPGPGSSCKGGAEVTCTVGEEWCPMPAASWRIRLWKLRGPAGAAAVQLVIGRARMNRS